MRKLKAGIIGATGMVGQKFAELLCNHPWFEVAVVAASEKSAGKSYVDAVGSSWPRYAHFPEGLLGMKVVNAADVNAISEQVDFVFSAISLGKEETAALEEDYAKCETPVVSNNSAHRWTPDVPMVIPEVNPGHIRVIKSQRLRLGVRRGFIATKPNCSIQSFVPPIHALRKFDPYKIIVSTYQAVSGAGKTLESWPEMLDNVIPFIDGEEEKSEKEPLKIWGKLGRKTIGMQKKLIISAQCVRVPVSNGHLATVLVTFGKPSDDEEIIHVWRNFKTKPQELCLPSAPDPFITYFEESYRPQTRLDRDLGRGMGIAVGRLRRDNPLFSYKFVALSHNTIRGAAGGAILLAELLNAEGYIAPK
jgi:aspartate-semialdehyde dehydrogenase